MPVSYSRGLFGYESDPSIVLESIYQDSTSLARSFWDQITVPTAYREYFKDQRKEILAPDKKNKDIYYVFKNVYQPVTCGWILCKEGNGTLERTFSNYTKAVKFVTGENKEPKKRKSEGCFWKAYIC